MRSISTRAFLILFLALSLIGCGGETSSSAAEVPVPSDGSYPVSIKGDVPPGATQLRVTAIDVEGEHNSTTTLPASDTVSVTVSADVSTLALEYLDDTGQVVASFVESASNLQEHDFRNGITDPPLVFLSPETQARENPVVGADIKFSFAFFGCNRAAEAGTFDSRPAFRDQLSQAEKDSKANVAQLRQHFEDIHSLSPRPKFIFLCGDVVQKPKTDELSLAPTILAKELRSWKKIRANGPVIINADGQEASVEPPAEGSLFPKDITVVVLPGNHEMCYRTRSSSQELPLEGSGPVFVSEMAPHIVGGNGPEKDVDYGDGGLGLPADKVRRDESKLSYTFRASADGQISDFGEYFFMVLNTDTYIGDGVENVGIVPLRWARQELSRAQQDETVRHIFVFGHRPVQAIYTEFGINPRQAELFFEVLNNPTATTAAALRTPDPNTKVRGYFCAHSHLMSTKQPSGDRPVTQLVCGSGGSEPDPTDNKDVKPYPWFGFGVVGVRDTEQVDAAFIGRNVHPSPHTPTGFWWEQEPLKKRKENISGPGDKPAKVPKAVRRLFPVLRAPLALPAPAALASTRYESAYESTFTDRSAWQVETFQDPAGSPVEYKQENVDLIISATGVRPNVEFLEGGGLRLKVAGSHVTKKGSTIVHSGRVRSHFRQKYGLFVYKARLPRGQHLWPALWTAGVVDGNNAWPKTGEIDVMETVLTIEKRPDFTSRIMVRTAQPDFPNFSDYLNNPWYASLPPDESEDIKTRMTPAQWLEKHTFAVDWYEVREGDRVTDVRYDFYLDAEVNAEGALVSRLDGVTPATKINSYSLQEIVARKNEGKIKVPDWETLNKEWSGQAFVLNVAVGGAWDDKVGEIKNGQWQPPTDGSADMLVDWVKCYQRVGN